MLTRTVVHTAWAGMRTVFRVESARLENTEQNCTGDTGEY